MPFLKAGPVGTVRAERGVVKTEEHDEGCRACTMPPPHADTHCNLERSAKQRGKVAHTARPGKPNDSAVNMLVEMRDELTMAVQEAEVWEEVEMVFDSRASGTVLGANLVRAIEGKHIQPGLTYQMADGSRVPHMGNT